MSGESDMEYSSDNECDEDYYNIGKLYYTLNNISYTNSKT